MNTVLVQKISIQEFESLISEVFRHELQKLLPLLSNSPPKQIVDNNLVSQKEAAALLNISIPTLRKLIAEKKIQPVKVGNRNKFRKNDVVNYKTS
jgi:excisionase family DNA binding protein